ncbi:MAG: IS66 family transposase [Rhodobacteraceae bacterium]|nr:IS66 family transposase [Paracoccaceae bacterium]
MEIVPQADTHCLPVVAGDNHSTPFAQETVTISKAEYIELKAAAGYWKALHARAQKQIDELKGQVEHWKGKFRKFKQRLFGKKSEKSSKNETSGQSHPSGRKRGQQKGSVGHGRTKRPHLPVVDEQRDLPEGECQCPHCGGAYDPFPGTEDSEILEIEVRGYKRKIRRKRYKKTCQCPQTPGIVTAPPAPRVIDRSPIGISIWVHILLGKYLYAQPLNRLLQALQEKGEPISPGTLIGGMQPLMVLFEPLMEALYRKQMSEDRFHADESRWEVFVILEGKAGSRWYLWLMLSASVVYYRIDPSRSAQVPEEHFSNLAQEVEEAILVCDRYSAYKKLARLNGVITLAYCWIHVRRDFLDGARSVPRLEGWMLEWVSAIGDLYAINKQRVSAWDPALPLEDQSPTFLEHHTRLQTALQEMKDRCDTLLQEDERARAEKRWDETLHAEQRKVLTSLQNHWDGLIVFVDHPEVSMDNNAAERNVRGPVCGRKNYWGSGSIWSAAFAAMMFSLFQTLGLWDINRDHWLSAYLNACADHGGKAPADLSPFLPWEMDQARRQLLSLPLSTGPPEPNDTS